VTFFSGGATIPFGGVNYNVYSSSFSLIGVDTGATKLKVSLYNANAGFEFQVEK
jgi:hypothetical protein